MSRQKLCDSCSEQVAWAETCKSRATDLGQSALQCASPYQHVYCNAPCTGWALVHVDMKGGHSILGHSDSAVADQAEVKDCYRS